MAIKTRTTAEQTKNRVHCFLWIKSLFSSNLWMFHNFDLLSRPQTWLRNTSWQNKLQTTIKTNPKWMHQSIKYKANKCFLCVMRELFMCRSVFGAVNIAYGGNVSAIQILSATSRKFHLYLCYRMLIWKTLRARDSLYAMYNIVACHFHFTACQMCIVFIRWNTINSVRACVCVCGKASSWAMSTQANWRKFATWLV